MTTNLPEKIHVELGASKAARWIACPGSVRLSKGIPNFESEYARAGTAAHAVLEMALRKGVDADMWEGLEVEGVEVDADMTQAVQVAVDYCRERMGRAATPNDFGIEDAISLESLNPPAPMRGTSDFWWYSGQEKELEVVDYKNGSGVVVEVLDNWQLTYYALGVALKHSAGREIERVKITVIQPNAGHPDGIVRSATIDYLELLGKADDLLKAAQRTFEPDAPLIAGSHCRFCPASPVCPAQRDQVQTLAQVAFADMPLDVPPAPETLPRAVLSEVLQKLPILEEWAKAVRAYAQSEAEAGTPIPGTKLVQKRANRSWVSEDAIAKFLRDELGLADEEIFTQKIKSPAQVEKIKGVGKKGLPPTMVKKESSGNKLVLDTDPRPAVAIAATDVFQALPPAQS